MRQILVGWKILIGWEGRKKLGGVEGGETVLRIHCIRKTSIFNKMWWGKELYPKYAKVTLPPNPIYQ